MPEIDHLLVAHEHPSPLHRTDPDKQQRKPEREPQPEIPSVGPQRPEIEVPVPRHGEVDNGEPDSQEWNRAEEESDLPGCAVGGLGIHIGQSR
jgi:hypothetical protein